MHSFQIWSMICGIIFFLSNTLKSPAINVMRHILLEHLETAINTTSIDYDKKLIRNFLDVRILEVDSCF